ncbi:MAG: hypothetical protein ACK4GW_13835 [Pseudorhodobacter sp.]
MSKAQSVKFLLVFWIVLFSGSLALRFLLAGGEPLDVALGRGLALILAQVLAAGAAILCWRAARVLPDGVLLRRLGQVPLLVTALLAIVVIWSVIRAVRAGAV